MKKVFIFILIMCASSCEYLNFKKEASEDILNQELETFNWNAVDIYPSFSTCDSTETKTEQKACFETLVSQHITTSLQNEIIVVTQDIDDTVVLEFQISEIGEIIVKDINQNDITATEIPQLKAIIAKSLNTLPKIFPAIKRNQPVKTEFKLPIVIAVN